MRSDKRIAQNEVLSVEASVVSFESANTRFIAPPGKREEKMRRERVQRLRVEVLAGCVRKERVLRTYPLNQSGSMNIS